MNIIKGQKIKLSEITSLMNIQIGISITYQGQNSIDIACFGLDGANKLSDDRYFIFYNQPSSPENAIRKISASDDTERFEIFIANLPGFIKKLVFTATIDGSDTMSKIKSGYLRLLSNNNELARFSFSGADFSFEKAIMIGEIYLKDVWRFTAVGQGFNGGLSSLLKHFGGEEVKETPPTEPPKISSAPPSIPPKVNISKVTLDKRGDKKKVDINKKNINQPIHINLNWDINVVKKGGFFGKKTIQADLDLGCMFSMTDGSIGVIQALGNSFGSKIHPPYIFLDKDDRTGTLSDGENLYIIRPDMLNFVMIFSFLYEGNANFSDVNGRVTIKDQTGNEIFIKLGNPDSQKMFCSICTIRNIGNEIEITKEERYFTSHPEADKHYGFGFNWKTGRK